MPAAGSRPQRRAGPPTPSSSRRRANLERQYRGLIASNQRNPRFSGDLQIYPSARIKRMGTSELSKLIRAAYRTPRF